MVHRGSTDSRLLLNLITHDKDYTKQLNLALEHSDISLTSLSAFAAVSSPPISNVILAVASSLAGADEALRRYVQSLEKWRGYLTQLKELEDDVARIMRDKEILVTRLVKVSGSSSSRSSVLLSRPPGTPSQSSYSDEALSTSYTQSHIQHIKLPGTSNKKLIAVQSELQACLAHLSVKERQLDVLRVKAVKDGLGLRGRTLAECGRRWEQYGKEILEELSDTKLREVREEQPVPLPSLSSNSVVRPPQNGTHDDQSSSDMSASAASSIRPEHSASQISLLNTGSGPEAISQEHSDYHLTIPPAHAIPSIGLPTSIPVATASRTQVMASQSHTLHHRITEEDLVEEPEDADTHQNGSGTNRGESAFEVVENVHPNQYIQGLSTAPSTPPPRRASNMVHITSKQKPLSVTSSPASKGGDRTRSYNKNSLETSTSGGSKLLGSIRGLFSRATPSPPKSSQPSVGVHRTSESRGRTSESWDTSRTDRNARSNSLSRGQSSSDEEDGRVNNFMSTPATPVARHRVFSEIRRSPTTSTTGARLKKPRTSGKPIAATVRIARDRATPSSPGQQSEVRLRRRSRSLDHIVVDLGVAKGIDRNSDLPLPATSRSDKPEIASTKLAVALAPNHAVRVPSNINPVAEGNSDLSRNSSLLSARSAASAPAASGSVLPGKRVTAEPFSSQKTSGHTGVKAHANKGSARGRSMDDIVITPVSANKPRSTAKRTTVPSTPTPRTHHQSQSLMAIVENVSKGSKETLVPVNSRSDTVKYTSNSLSIPKAPQSIFSPPVSNTSADHSIHSRPRTTSYPIQNGKPSNSTLLQKKPLRSAMKQTSDSRSPSPMPSHVTGEVFATSSASSVSDHQVKESLAAIGGGSPRPVSVASDISGGSEYETGQENFDDDNGSDLSTIEPAIQHGGSEASGTTTTTTTTTTLTSTREASAPINKEAPPVPEKTTRRKSVRVSLKPTYAVMPPMVEYEEPETLYSNYDNHGLKPGPTSWLNDPKSRRDVWDDSSDDEGVNADYLEARRRLGRSQRPDTS